jgi:uncharacterized RDD family membrane protein YckC
MPAMSEGTPNGPGQPRMPWEPETPQVEPPGLPPPARPGWTPQELTDPTTPWTPTPAPGPAPAGTPSSGPIPAVPGGIISASPTSWARPPAAQVEVAPGLTFADTTSRVIGYIIDWIVLFFAISIVAAVLASVMSLTASALDESVANTIGGPTGSIAFTAIGLAYFVGSWTGGRRATIGQRAMGIQVGNAFDGRPLSLAQALRRWLGLGHWLGLLAIVPSLSSPSGLMQLLWVIILLITTATSPTKQGLHDRFANSALVRPLGQGTSGVAKACLVIVVVLLLLFVISIVALVYLGGQLSTILSQVGESI